MSEPPLEPSQVAGDVKPLGDRALHFLATASNETLGACLVGLGAGTYLVLGRVGLVLIGVVGGVVLHATWDGHAHHGPAGGTAGTSAEARRRELGVEVAYRVLDWRTRAQAKNQHDRDHDRDHDALGLSLKLYSGTTLDYSSFQPETAAALAELTDAVIRDYVKYVRHALSGCCSNGNQVVVLPRTPCRRHFPRIVPPNNHCIHRIHILTSLPEATGR